MKVWIILFFSCCIIAHARGQEQSVQLYNEQDSLRLQAYDSLFRRYQSSDIDSAIYYAEQGLAYANRQRYARGRLVMLICLASAYDDKGEKEKALAAAQEAMLLAVRIHDIRGIAATNNILGVIEGSKGNYLEATRYFLSTLKLYHQINYQPGIANTYLKLGVVNEMIGEYDKALEYYSKALSILEVNTNNSPNIPYLYNNIGTVYSRKNDFERAIAAYYRALQTSDFPEYRNIRSLPLANLGKIYAMQGHKNKAIRYYRQALSMLDKEEKPENRARILIQMGELYANSDPAKAINLIQDALFIARNLQMKTLQTEALDALIELSTQLGDYRHAYEYLEEKTILNDSIYSIEKAKEIAELQAIHDLESSQAKIQILQSASERNMQQRIMLLLVVCTVTISLIVVVITLVRTRKMNKKLTAHEQELQHANSVKDRLFSIIGHDLHTPLNSIPEMLDVYKNAPLSNEEKEFIVQTIGDNAETALQTLEKLIHWGQYKLSGISSTPSCFRAYDLIEVQLKKLRVDAAGKQIVIHNLVPQDWMVEMDVHHFRFVIQSLVSNAVKYSRSNGRIDIQATQQADGFICFSIKDNGVGIGEERQRYLFEVFQSIETQKISDAGNSIGLMLCKDFIKENGGDIWVESEKGNGTVFYFTVRRYIPYLFVEN